MLSLSFSRLGTAREACPEENAVVAEGLVKLFGKFPAVRGVDLQVARGRVLGILGPNGAGKTTLIKMLCGLLLPTRGRVLVLGHDPARAPGAVRQRLGYVSQRFSLYPELTAGENMSFYASVYGLQGARRRERLAAVGELLGLGEWWDQRAADLPRGVGQRLALGCALLHEPELLFLDEPTAGMDPRARRSFWKVIQGLAARGTTVLVTTHYMDEAVFCEELVFMRAGEVLTRGTPDEVKERAGAATLEEAFVKLALGRERAPGGRGG